jgi:hypothetical protein
MKTYRPLTTEQAQDLWELEVPFEYRFMWSYDKFWSGWFLYGKSGRGLSHDPKDVLRENAGGLAVEFRIEVEEDGDLS